ncbi:fatty acid synthase isoform X2 [Teleopsis dalmanni]|uniref:fatty acid synthase isoform X2 n=1 Tax=Teleopsis dalmanni TaxID=139649 RepID=UPI0018CEE449|nr:fatty acid synthase isoform X2 [Teleopsis dalmanni]
MASHKFNKKYSRVFPETDGDDIVISGIAGKFPNSHNTSEFRYNLYNKIDMVDDDERRWRHFNSEIPKRSGKIYELSKFDATFFGVHFKQSHTMDPQTRIIIETAYEAVIDAGICPKSLRGTKTGVYVGSCISESEKTWFYEKVPSGGFGITGCSRAMMANRISYSLGLQGPSYLLDTACSSSMYALDNAFSAIRNGEIDAAIIGGANLSLHPNVTLQFARLGVLAADGYCRPFDKNACGYTRSEAISCMLLQRKRDAKRIYASVLLSKTNCDGYKPEGITYPSGKLQEQLLSEFYKEIDITPDQLGYLEAHSTGTVVGDPEECRAVDSVLCSKRNKPLLVGSIKSNIGHSEAASGICSLIKACFAFETGKISPNLNFEEVKPEIPALAEGRLKVVNDLTELEQPYIGVNSFGFGGANAHALLKAHEKQKINFGLPDDNLPRLVTWAGRTEDAVNVVFDEVGKKSLDAEFIALLQNTQKDEVPGMVFRGYGIFKKNDSEPAITLARDVQHFTGIKRPIVWVFSGMGSQWNEMGTSLMNIPLFKGTIEKCHEILLAKNINLINILTSKDPHIFDNILHSFVGIAAIQIAIVNLLHELTLKPDYIIGHSVGELGCGYADGGFTLEQMILAAYYRGKVSLDVEKIKGSMAAIGIGYKKIIKLLPKTIEVACHNNADSCTISGPTEDVTQFISELKNMGIFAKEVPCSNIAYHSRYISHMGPQLLTYLKEIIPIPKNRSNKWLSTSVPKTDWEKFEHNLCSAEYHTNNLLSSVLFEETLSLLPNNVLTIEIAPHGLLQSILRQSISSGVHIPLTNRNNIHNELFLLTSLGKLFNNGITFPLDKLYPKIEFPVSRDTASISSLIKWDHSEDWFVTRYENMKTRASGERILKVNIGSDDDEYISGHVIDGKVLIPATCYLQYVWQTFSLMYHGPSYMDIPVEFDDIRFLRATSISKNSNIELTIMIHYGTGNFEITESGTLVVTGRITEIENPVPPVRYNFKENSEFPIISKKDFYKELKLRGYHYNGTFKAVHSARCDGLYGNIEWDYNWVTFMDAMLQIQILGVDCRSLLVPTKIRKLRIFGLHHFDVMSKMDPENKVLEVFIDQYSNRIISGGIEIIGVEANEIQRRRPTGNPVLEICRFVPQFPTPLLSLSDGIRISIQLALENTPVRKLKVVEIDTNGKEPIIKYILDAVEDLPLITGDYMYLTNQEIEDIPNIHIENGKITSQSNCNIIIVSGILEEENENNLTTISRCLINEGYVIIRENPDFDSDCNSICNNFKIISNIRLHDSNEILLLLQKLPVNKEITERIIVEVSINDKEFKWIKEIQTALSNKNEVIAYAYNENLNGLLGFLNCLRKEPDGNLVSCFFIQDELAPAFSLDNPFYANQYALRLAVNVYQNGHWGSYRHLKLLLNNEATMRQDHVYGNVLNRGDLSSLRWFEGPSNPKDCDVRVMYSAINFRDVMLATGRLSLEMEWANRHDSNCVLGFEYSGINLHTGRRIMSMVQNRGFASYVEKSSPLIWNIPDHWSLEEAATVPVVYLTVYYAFFMTSDIRKGKTILIHAGTGGIGLAAIRIALAYNLEVFTTCSSAQKKQFLLDKFPQLKESHIGNSRDTSFEYMIQQETKGMGVDFVLNSLSEDKLLASIRCLGSGGTFMEIGKFDMMNDSKLGMSNFLNEIKFHPIRADRLLYATEESVKDLKSLMDTDIENGVIIPLPSTVFSANEMEKAFRYLVGGKHIGKVVIQIRENEGDALTVPIPVLQQVYFNPHLSYIIVGGLGGFGLELADWMVIRGAKNVVLSSRHGVSKDYQRYRLALWKTYGCNVIVSTADVSIINGCHELISEAEKLGPVGGIFNLAVVLRDAIFINQTEQMFKESFVPKVVASKHLDEISRVNCPKLEYFVVFSSVSCGRGNAGQTNYGMANSIMERIIEDRIKQGYPAKAIQWGAVGEVGLVAEIAEDKIDIEIGGTLQQRISSCLRDLDTLLTVTDAVVSSMVVAEKHIRSGNLSITETVMNIMGIRDLKTISLGTTLSEMGMDSLMAVEIKQTLERDFELILTPQDLRSLTFQKLQEYSDARNQDNTKNVKMILASDIQLTGIDMLLRNLGDESQCNEIIVPLKTASDLSNQNTSSIIIPGLEGTSGQSWCKIGSYLTTKANLLQYHQFANMTNPHDIAAGLLEHTKSILKISEPYYIIGYSFGTLIAIELAAMLEKAGYRGQILLIDGAPHFLKKLTLARIGETISDNDLYNIIISTIVHQIFPEESLETTSLVFMKFNKLSEKMDKFMEYVAKQDMYSENYTRIMINAMFNRIRMTAKYNVDEVKDLKSPITLIRPAEVSLLDIEDDYCLSELTSGKVIMKIIEGNHSTMLDNPMLPQLINEYHPARLDDKEFQKHIFEK